MTYRVAYIDEELEDRDDYSQLLKTESLNIIPIDPFAELEPFVEYLLGEKFNAIIVDYTLFATRPDIKYTGVELVKSIWERREDFPAFIITNNRDQDSVDNEIESTKVFIKKQVSKDEASAEEVQHKIKKEIEFYNSENVRLKEELYVLVEKRNSEQNLSDLELQKIQDLNEKIENRININEGFTDIVKDSENMRKLSSILDEAESFLKKINKDE